jgi:hypothetical protein
VLGELLAVTLILAGAVTYYYHLNEPTDDDEDGDQPAQVTRLEREYEEIREAYLRQPDSAAEADEWSSAEEWSV